MVDLREKDFEKDLVFQLPLKSFDDNANKMSSALSFLLFLILRDVFVSFFLI